MNEHECHDLSELLLEKGQPEIDPGRPELTVYLIAEADVADIIAAQRRLIFELEESGQVALILCEHRPAITIGRSGSRAHILPDDDELCAEGLSPRWIARGGGCWLHVPGQLAGYLIGDLGTLADSADEFLLKVELALTEVMADFDVNANADEPHSGLFVGGRRVAALGVSVLRNMVHYGFLLNVGPYMRQFEVLSEPGPDQRPLRQTSMEAVRLRPVSPSRLRARLVQEFRTRFRLGAGPVFTENYGLSPLPEVG
jgi:lipoyl(octanoyl) transferase